MWVVRQADDPFVYFGAKLNQGLGLEISDEAGIGRGKAGPRESREGKLAKEPREGRLAKGTQRGSVGEERRREAVDNGQQKGPVKMSWQS